MVDIFSVPEKTTINKTLGGLSISVVGRPKVGKTTFAASFPKPIFLCTENGISNVVGITPIPISTWSDFKQSVNQLSSPKGREKFDTVVIDSMTNLLLLLDKYTGSKLTTEKNTLDWGSEADYGKGNKTMRAELGFQLQKLTNQGYTVINIVHAEDKSDFDTGKTYIGTSLPSSIYGTLEKFVDLTVFLDRKEDKKTHDIEYQIHFTPKCGFAGTGGRFTPKVDSVPTDYKSFEQAIFDAIDERTATLGATAVVNEKPIVAVQIETQDTYNLKDQKAEFEELTQKIIEQDKNNVATIQSIIANVLGPNKKVANLIEGQEELLAEILTMLKSSFDLQ